ncbi:hypothetical protein C8Q79DRAFT_931810 [Trametes meyenii]|nr:hypothetical protein C8Q79DRAFT_931810 [Trametes meyenii]
MRTLSPRLRAPRFQKVRLLVPCVTLMLMLMMPAAVLVGNIAPFVFKLKLKLQDIIHYFASARTLAPPRCEQVCKYVTQPHRAVNNAIYISAIHIHSDPSRVQPSCGRLVFPVDSRSAPLSITRPLNTVRTPNHLRGPGPGRRRRPPVRTVRTVYTTSVRTSSHGSLKY